MKEEKTNIFRKITNIDISTKEFIVLTIITIIELFSPICYIHYFDETNIVIYFCFVLILITLIYFCAFGIRYIFEVRIADYLAFQTDIIFSIILVIFILIRFRSFTFVKIATVFFMIVGIISINILLSIIYHVLAWTLNIDLKKTKKRRVKEDTVYYSYYKKKYYKKHKKVENPQDFYTDYQNKMYENFEEEKKRNTIFLFEHTQYFKQIASLSQVRPRYIQLMKQYHPDNFAGDTGVAQAIQEEYNKICETYNIT